MALAGNCLVLRAAAGDWMLKSRNTGRVRLTGVMPAVCGVRGCTFVGLDLLELAVKGVLRARRLLPPHLAHFGFSPLAVIGESEVTELRRPLRFG